MITPWAYYHAEHPYCEISSCGVEGSTHHIRSRGRKGAASNDHSRTNLITLCLQHHTEAHSLGRVKFPAKYGLEVRWKAAFARES